MIRQGSEVSHWLTLALFVEGSKGGGLGDHLRKPGHIFSNPNLLIFMTVTEESRLSPQGKSGRAGPPHPGLTQGSRKWWGMGSWELLLSVPSPRRHLLSTTCVQDNSLCLPYFPEQE